jgi:4-amino-4-deoxy-L-arabinose transferase-like glycosyltransferase
MSPARRSTGTDTLRSDADLDAAQSASRVQIPAKRTIFTGGAIVLLIAAVKLLLHLYAARYYGYFPDEMYFIACSNHLAWGYVDLPPLIAVVLKITRALFGDSLQSIRFFAALAGAANILLAGRIARELGGGRFAQGLAALSVLAASANLSMNHYMSMNAFEPLFWMGCALLVIRIIKTGNQKLWLWVGLIAGVGLNNKYSMVFFCIGIIAGLLLTRERRAFLQPWIWLAALLAFLLTLPNLIWNAQHNFPFLELMANIRRNGANMAFTPARFLAIQAVFVLPVNLPVWLSGLWWYLFGKDGKTYRVLGYAYLVVLAIMFLPNGKPYYLLPVYPMLMAAGAVALENWFSRPRLQWAKPAFAVTLLFFGISGVPFALPVLSPETYLRYSTAMHFAPPPIERIRLGPMPHFFADQFGWEEMTQVVARAYNSLPPEERKNTVSSLI